MALSVRLRGRVLESDKRKLIVALGLLLAFAFGVTALANYLLSRAAIHESITASALPLTSDNIYSEIQKDLIRPILISSLMASDTFLRDWVLAGEKDVERVTRFLREVKERFGAFTSFFVSDRTLTYYQAQGILKTISPDDDRDVWYFRVRRMEAPYELNLDPDAANRDALTIFINYRVFDYDGNYIGATGVGLTVDAVRSLIERYQERYERSIYFTDRRGNLKLVGNESAVAAANISEIEGLQDIAPRILADGAGTFQYSRGGREHLVNVRFIPELDWHLFVEQSIDGELERARRTLYVNLLVSAAVTLIVLLLTSLTINRYQRRLEQMATTDKLTGLWNRQAFELLVPQAIRESVRARAPLAAIVIDIDYFKPVNDRYGHAVGDEVIAEVGTVIRDALRRSDIVCRWGGEEFLVIAKGLGLAEGEGLAEKVRRAVEQSRFTHDGEAIPLTVSAGVAVHRTGETPDQLVARADSALYAAKEAGRNTVRSTA